MTVSLLFVHYIFFLHVLMWYCACSYLCGGSYRGTSCNIFERRLACNTKWVTPLFNTYPFYYNSGTAVYGLVQAVPTDI